MNNDLSVTATQLLNDTLNCLGHMQDKMFALPDEIRRSLLSHEALNKTLIGILAEAKELKEDATEAWDQRMKARIAYNPTVADLYASIERNASETHKQFAIRCELAFALFKMFFRIIVMIQPALDKTPKDSQSLAAYYNEHVLSIVHEITQPEWSNEVLFSLRYPELARIIQEKITAQAIIMLPEPHQSAASDIMQQEGASAAMQKITNEMSEEELLDPHWVQKNFLLEGILSSISQDGAFAALASHHLPAVSQALSEKALHAFLEAAIQSINATHIERFIGFLKLTLNYPELSDAIQETVIKKIVSLMPDDYQDTLAAQLQGASLVVVLQTMESQIPSLVNDHALSEEAAQKVMLVSVAVNTFLQQKTILALANSNMSVMPLALEDAIEDFINAAIQDLQAAHQNQVIDDRGQPNLCIQACVEKFIAFLNYTMLRLVLETHS